MILFPANAQYTNIIGSKIIDKNKRKLEETLRKLGNFDSEKPIEVLNHHHGASKEIIIYELKDLDETIFTFTNFSTGNFDEAHGLTMKRKGSKFIYKYTFFESSGVEHQEKQEAKNYVEELRVIEISCSLKENIKIKFERKRIKPIRIIIEVGTKKYILETTNFYGDKTEEKLLEELESIVEKLLKTETINLENILASINNKEIINDVYIINGDKTIAQINFRFGELYSYELEQPLMKVNAIITPPIYRSTQRVVNNRVEITNEVIQTESGYEKVQTDCKILFKKL